MRKLNLKSIKEGKLQGAATQLSQSEMAKLKGGVGCISWANDGYGNWFAEAEDPYCSYPDSWNY